jgi:hypothetical protein
MPSRHQQQSAMLPMTMLSPLSALKAARIDVTVKSFMHAQQGITSSQQS